jgi:hypothetical protein
MGKKILFIVLDENGSSDNPRHWDNLGELTTFSGPYGGNPPRYNEGGNSWKTPEQALMYDFGLAGHGKTRGGGLVLLLDYEDRNGTFSVSDKIIYTEPMMEERQALEDELGGYDDSEEIAERLGYEFRGVDGLMIVPFAKIISEYGSLDEDAIARATSCLKGEMNTYNLWASGEVYGGVLVDAATGEEEDALYGFIGDPEESGLLEHFEYDEIANDGDPYYSRREMDRAVAALIGDEDEDADEGYDFDDEDEDGGRTPNPRNGLRRPRR